MHTRSVLSLALVAAAIGMAAGFQTASDSAAKPGTVNDARILAEKNTGNNWLVNGRMNDSTHFSPLQQINDKNVANLGLAWYLDIEGGMGVVSEPLVVDGVIYFSAPLSKVFAVDAASGKLLWKFDPEVRLNLSLNGSYSSRTNGGVAVWNGKVYVGTGDCRLVAIDAATAKQVWEAKVCEPLQTGITGAPHVAKGKILMGFNGSDDGVRGALVAYDAETGKEVWRFWTVPVEQKASVDAIREGEKLYVTFYCEGCHSPGIDGSGAWVLDGAVPDLRYAPGDVHKDWYQIVLGGSHWEKGMPGLSDPPKFAFPKAHMTVAQADAVHAYVIDQAWKAYKGEQQAAHSKKPNY